MTHFIPAALRSHRSYNGKLYTRKDLLEHIILNEGFINKIESKRKNDIVYRLKNQNGRQLTFAAKAEKKYIDVLLKKLKQGSTIEMEHKNTIEKIKSSNVDTLQAAKLIAADHIAEDKNYYEKLQKYKLEQGGQIQNLSKGTILEGPSHEQGGIDIQVNGKTVAEAEGEEIVINKNSSKLFCEQLSEINQAGGGKKLDCNKSCDSCDHKMENGGLIKSKSCENSTQIQTIIVDKQKYSLTQAIDWIKQNNFDNNDVDETIHTYRFRQQNPNKFKENSFKTIELKDGVMAVIACPVEKNILEDGGEIKKKIEENLRKKEETKEFKDTDIVNYTKKYAAQYSLITSADLEKIEQDNITAYKLIEKSKIWEPYNIETLKEQGNSSGAAYLKVKLREALTARPFDSKDAREAYIKSIEKLKFDLENKKRVTEITEYLFDFYQKTQSSLIPFCADKMNKSDCFVQVFGKKFYNFIKFKGESASKILAEAFLYQDYNQQMRVQEIEKRRNAIKNKINSINTVLKEIDSIDNVYEIKQIMNKYDIYYDTFNPTKEAIILFLNNRLEIANKSYENASQLTDIYKVRENDWSWTTKTKDKKETQSEEKDPTQPQSILDEYGITDWRKSAKRTPLEFIKRTGGISVEKISVNEVTEKFGYKNVIFGNYVNDAERKENLKHFLGAMLDLHEIMNIDIVSLNKLGGLDINFGSTGCGAFSLAMACYMPQLKAINLTKKRGDGCIAHEWSHYLDNILAEGSEKKATKQQYATYLKQYINNNKQLQLLFTEFINWLNNGGEDRIVNVKYYPTKKYKYRLYGNTSQESIAEIQKKNNYYTQYKNANDPNVLRYYGYIAHKQNDNKPLIVPMKTKQCMFMYQSSLYGDYDYWTNPKEIFARAFEWYIEDYLEKSDRINTYLVNTKNSLGLMYYLIPFDKHPYPRTEPDKEFLRNWFQKLFEAIRLELNIGSFSWNNNERVDEYLDFKENELNSEIDSGVKVLDTGKIIVDGDDIEAGEKGYSFKRNIVKTKMVYTILFDNETTNHYISKIDNKWNIYTVNDNGTNNIIDTLNTLEQCKQYAIDNNIKANDIQKENIVNLLKEKELNKIDDNMAILNPIFNKQSDKYYLLMDYYVNNRIDFSKLPILIQENIIEIFDITRDYASNDSWLGQLPEGKEVDKNIDEFKNYPHKLLRVYWNDIDDKAVSEILIEPAIRIYDEIMEKYPSAIITAQEEQANYILFEDFINQSDSNDFRNMDFEQFVIKNENNNLQIQIAAMVWKNPHNYSVDEIKQAEALKQQLKQQFRTVISGAITSLYYDRKITDCQLSYNHISKIIRSADLIVPKHYKLLSETSCQTKKQALLAKNKAKAQQLYDLQQLQAKQKENEAKQLKELKQKSKASVKSVKAEVENEIKQKSQTEAHTRKIKLAKAKAQAQKQRIRILALKK